MLAGRCSSKLSNHELQAKSKKSQALSEAPRRSIPYQMAYGAESKDPGDACWQMLFQAFQPRTTSQIKKVTSSDRSEPGNPGERSGGTCGSLDRRPTQPEAHLLFIKSVALFSQSVRSVQRGGDCRKFRKIWVHIALRAQPFVVANSIAPCTRGSLGLGRPGRTSSYSALPT